MVCGKVLSLSSVPFASACTPAPLLSNPPAKKVRSRTARNSLPRQRRSRKVLKLPYDLYRDCRPAEDVFHIEKTDLPQNPEGQVFSPVAFLGENTLLGSLYEAADGVPSDQGAAALGRLDLQTGEWQKLVSPQGRTTDTVLTFNDAYIVYWEMPLSDAEGPTPGKASLCVYDRRAEEAYALFEYPEEFLKSALVYGNHIVLVEDRLYFDTVVPRIEGTKTMVYSADLPARSVTPYKENAQHPPVRRRKAVDCHKPGRYLRAGS